MVVEVEDLEAERRGGRFQDPRAEGADVVTFSTFKSYGGPAADAIATGDANVAERESAAVYPGLTSNYDAGRLRAPGLAATAPLRTGPAYADVITRVAVNHERPELVRDTVQAIRAGLARDSVAR